MTRTIATLLAALVLGGGAAAAQTYDDDGHGWGPYYNNHLSQYDGRPLGPPLGALPPGTEYYNGVPRAGYPLTTGSAFGPERAYGYGAGPGYRPARVAGPRHAGRSHRVVKRRIAEHRR
jgi:hypothetical protein